MTEKKHPYFKELAILLPYLLLNKKEDEKILPEQWSTICRLLSVHGLIPFFIEFEGLKYHDPETNIKNQLLQQAKNITANNLKKMVVQNELENKFNTKDIPFVFLKGLNLSRLIYENPTIRPLLDIDILTKKEYEKQIRDFLISKGAKSTSGLQNKFVQQLISHNKPLLFKEVLIELHTHIVPEKEIKYFSKINLLSNIKNYSDSEGKFKAFYPGFYMFYLCYHAHRHLLSGKIKLLWYVDIACLITKFKFNEEDFSIVMSLAAQTNTTPEIEASLYIVKKYLKLPDDIKINIVPNEKLEKLTEKFRVLMLKVLPEPPSKSYYIKTWQKLSAKEKIIYIFSILFPSISYIQSRFKIKSRIAAFLFLIINPLRILLKIILYPFRI